MTIFVFPGQGSQHVGMAKDFYDKFDIAKKTFNEIEEYVNLDLKKIIFDNKEGLLDITNYTQISIFTASLTIFKTILDVTELDQKNINFVLGHSLGEYSALACSNKINLEDCSKILKKRGDLMNNAVTPNKTGMAALIGLSSKDVQNIISKFNLDLEIANDNSPIQVVISGDTNELDSKKEIFLNNKVKKFVKLNVSSAFHSKFMIDAQNQLANEIDNIEFISNETKLISNYTGQGSNDSAVLKNSLKEQMSNKVRWTESIQNLSKHSETKIIEIGPGKVLSGLIKRISNKFDIISVNTITDLEKL